MIEDKRYNSREVLATSMGILKVEERSNGGEDRIPAV
jgi:hypothetical protein